MAEVYQYLVRPVSKDGQSVLYENQWMNIETFLNERGESGYHVVATLGTTQQRQIVLETAASISG